LGLGSAGFVLKKISREEFKLFLVEVAGGNLVYAGALTIGVPLLRTAEKELPLARI